MHQSSSQTCLDRVYQHHKSCIKEATLIIKRNQSADWKSFTWGHFLLAVATTAEVDTSSASKPTML